MTGGPAALERLEHGSGPRRRRITQRIGAGAVERGPPRGGLGRGPARGFPDGGVSGGGGGREAGEDLGIGREEPHGWGGASCGGQWWSRSGVRVLGSGVLVPGLFWE